MLAKNISRASLFVFLALFAVAVWAHPALFAQGNSDKDKEKEFRGRPDLQICVQSLQEESVPPNIMGLMRSALAQVSKHPHFKAAKMDVGGGPKLKAGCPLPSGLKNKQLKVARTDEPNPIFTFVFIASQEELQDVSFKGDVRVVPQEMMCEVGEDEGVCNEVTKAIYITPEELEDPQMLARALTAGVGLMNIEQAAPIYTDEVTEDKDAAQ